MKLALSSRICLNLLKSQLMMLTIRAHHHHHPYGLCIIYRSFATVNTNSVKEKATNTTPRYQSKKRQPLDVRRIAQLIDTQPWSPNLKRILSATLTTRLPNDILSKLLNLIKTPKKATHFLIWAQNSGLACKNERSYYTLLEIFGRNGDHKAARNLALSIEKVSGGSIMLQDKFFNCLIRNLGSAGLIKESVNVLPMMKFVGVAPSVITFNSLLNVLMRKGQTIKAKNLFEEMMSPKYGINPDVFTFNIMIRGFCMNVMVDEGVKFFKDMKRFECVPDIITYNTLVDGLCRTGKVEVAHIVVKSMKEKEVDLMPNVVTYTTLIRGYCGKSCISDALEVLDEMSDCGVKANEFTYNILIQGLCEAREFDKITEVWEGMIKDGKFYPDTCTFNTLMNAHCNAGKLDKALIVFNGMMGLNVPIDAASYSILIRSLCEKKDFKKAETLVVELCEKEILLRDDGGCKPLVAAYNPIFEYFCSKGQTVKARRLFNQLSYRGTYDNAAFKTLILGHCREGDFKAGYDLLLLMLRRDFIPDVEIYNSLIEGFSSKKEAYYAHKMLEMKLKGAHKVETATFHRILGDLIIQGFVGGVASLIKVMLQKRIYQNINLSTDSITLLYKSRLFGTALDIIQLLYKNGFKIKMEEPLNYLLQSEEFVQARVLLLFNLEKNQRVGIEICSACISGLCKIKKTKEAFSLYYDLIEKSQKQSLSCLIELKNTLEDDGRSKEAAFVSNRIERMNQENENSNKLLLT